MEKLYDPSEVYTRYKAYIATRYAALRQETRQIVEREQLVSVLNDTRWIALQTAVLSVAGFRPAYQVQYLTDREEYSPRFDHVPYYQSWWEFVYEDDECCFPPYFNIRWLSIQPRQAIYRGQLVEPEIIDRTDLLTDILHRCRIPYEKIDPYTFFIQGYI